MCVYGILYSWKSSASFWTIHRDTLLAPRHRKSDATVWRRSIPSKATRYTFPLTGFIVWKWFAFCSSLLQHSHATNPKLVLQSASSRFAARLGVCCDWCPGRGNTPFTQLYSNRNQRGVKMMRLNEKWSIIGSSWGIEKSREFLYCIRIVLCAERTKKKKLVQCEEAAEWKQLAWKSVTGRVTIDERQTNPVVRSNCVSRGTSFCNKS